MREHIYLLQIRNIRQIKPITLNRYKSNIRKVFRNVFDIIYVNEDTDVPVEYLKQFYNIKQFLEKEKLRTRRTTLTALIVLIKSLNMFTNNTIKKYNDYMFEIEKQCKEIPIKHKNIDFDKDDLMKIITNKYQMLNIAFRTIQIKTMQYKDLDEIQQYLTLSLYIKSNMPLRNEYAEIFIYDDNDHDVMTYFDIYVHNYFDINEKCFVIHKTKRGKPYEQKIPVDQELVGLIEIWLDVRTYFNELV